ncbi:DUF309 domain-containing protein [Bacillus paralicheniformis]|uniref:DUF309 domain-containing protein n=1 Tax=Bacillus paralicheniformis TaxID=1648923 RepID=A0A7Z1B2N5_9BACI|nr:MULTISPECIES: DUF309 domain-containing protein [Bacillus]MBC8623202.1 DUF309 domain-containing protein [Robertmurraya crescens]POO80797.1 DUF309 domain-containing protein [Bacillus sp. MBGLi97]KAA0836359.1 DUF309 domain-containing protein [Bacillus paralicheniformis]KAA0843457.1 DUF309 domain-containing protein [Bacillus paralicheniformis]MBL7474638.1 DUF309 domain-containing protein [Bacillus paralicheniformis]
MYPQAYIDYLAEFHGSRDYFECHEILEDHWKKDNPGERKSYWVGLIQLAVALYHQRRNNFAGAERLMANSIRILVSEKDAVESLGLDYSRFIKLLRKTYQKIKAHSPYESIMLPITDESLIKACRKQCEKKSYEWGANDPPDAFIIDKHLLRDRTEVVAERKKQIERRKKSRG